MRAKKLLKLLIDKDMSKKELADLTGITDRQVRRITIGVSNGSLSWWRKAAEVLGVELKDILE